MKRYLVAVTVGAALLLPCAPLAQAPSAPRRPQSLSPHLRRDVSFHSAALTRQVTYRAFLPADYDRSRRAYPVLYLLHGLFGEYRNWDTLTRLRDHVSGADLIVVMPDADNSWYANAPGTKTARYEDYFINDVISDVDRRFRTRTERGSRAIAGLSMGGYGAVKFALKYPQLFSFAGSLSGAFDAPLDLAERHPEYAESLAAAFGPDDAPSRAQEDVFALLRQADITTLPYFYVDCGAEDPFLQVNRRFVALLNQRQAAYEYHEIPGKHDWEYWERQVQSLLAGLRGRLRARP